MWNKCKKEIEFLILFTVSIIVTLMEVQARAPEQKDILENQSISIGFEKVDMRFKEGYLDVPEKIKQELFIYQCITETVDRYVTENNIDDTFYFDLKEDMLYGSREFTIDVPPQNTFEYPLQIKEDLKFGQDSYKFRIKGENDILYIEINLMENKIYLYPEAGNYYIFTFYDIGNLKAYERYEKEEKDYLNLYIISDWDDMKVEDDHLAEVPLKEIGNLDYLVIPEEDIKGNEQIYLDVASALKRYIDEKQINDVFYFNADRDIVSNVTNMIFTCRVRGTSQTLYIDIGIYSYEDGIRCHVYQVEE